MKRFVSIFFVAACAASSFAQTTAKPAAPAATAKPAATASKSSAAGNKLPAGIPAVKAITKTFFTVSLRYQDIKIGTGDVAEPNKMYKILYTGWRAADGVKFDSTDDHPRPPVLDKDGKPVMGDDGKPKLGDPQPISFPQGMGGVILGFDQGFAGMKIGGKRRLFIPWQLAYGTRAIPDRGPGHPGIPAKSDLIFDVVLVSVSDMPTPANHPGMGGMPGAHPMGGAPMSHPAPAGQPAAPATPAQPAAPATPATPATPAASAKPAAPATPATAPAPATPSTPAQPQSK
jgi:peptidylprolyl isomerase